MEKAASPRKVGLLTATSLVVGNMIASGVFMLPATLAGYGGISLVGWLVSCLGAMSLALVFGWLSHIKPDATGGPYAYVRAGLGDFAGYLVAWGYWISVLATNAAIAVAFVSYLSAFIPVLAEDSGIAILTGLGAIWLLTWINTLGIREAGFVQTLTTILKIAPLLVVAVGGLFYIDTSHFQPFNASGESDLSAITSVTTLTLFAFLGLECATIPSESIENAKSTIAKATVIGTIIATVIYVLGTVAVMGILPPEVLKGSNAPFADAGAAIWGESARMIIGAGAVVATFGALNGWIIVQGQIPMAAARDRLFSHLFSKENKKGMPAIGIVISSVLVSVMMFMNFSNKLADTYKWMILLSTFTSLTAYILSMPAFITLISRGPMSRKEWIRVSIALLGFLFGLWAVIGSGENIVYWGFVIWIGGVPLYALMKMRQQRSGSN